MSSFLILLIISIIFLFFVYIIRDKLTLVTPATATPIIQPPVWGVKGNIFYTPVSTTDGQCQVYTTKMTNIHLPTLPSLKKMELTYTQKPKCYDADQLAAQKVTHTCLSDSNLCRIEGGGCLGYDGKCYKLGETETYWRYCTDIEKCTGYVGVILRNINIQKLNDRYVTEYTEAECLTVTGDTVQFSPMNLTLMDGEYPAQLFRVEYGTYDKELKQVKADPLGTLFRIVHRPTGLYLAPSEIKETFILTGAPSSTAPTKYIIGAAGDLAGYWWRFESTVAFSEIYSNIFNMAPTDIIPDNIRLQKLLYVTDPTNIQTSTCYTYKEGLSPSFAPYTQQYTGLSQTYIRRSGVYFLNVKIISSAITDPQKYLF